MFASTFNLMRGFGRRAGMLLAFGVVAATGSAAQAELMHYTFTGKLTQADPSTGVAPGTTFTGSFAYDPTANKPGTSYLGASQFYSGQSKFVDGSTPDGSGLTINIGGKPIYSNTSGLAIGLNQIDYANQYGYQATPRTNVALSNAGVDNGPLFANLSLTNSTTALYHSTDSTTSAANLSGNGSPAMIDFSKFDSSIMTISSRAGANSGVTLYQGTISNVAPIPAPEPATVLVLGTAVAGWVLRRSRRKAAK